MVTAKDLVSSMKHLNTVMKKDNKAGHQWRYYNGKRSKSTFEATRKAGLYITNCMGGVAFACKYAGVPASALQWYGGMDKIVWLSDRAKENAHKYFDVYRIKRTVRDCIKKGILQPGDLVTYRSISHTNAYYGNNKSFDAGHAFCHGSGEGAPYYKWIGTTPYKGYHVAYIFRLKGDYTYRVQVGAYAKKANADKRVAEVAQASGFGCFVEQTDRYRVYCGSFKNFQNAIDRIDDLERAGIKEGFIISI